MNYPDGGRSGPLFKIVYHNIAYQERIVRENKATRDCLEPQPFLCPFFFILGLHVIPSLKTLWPGSHLHLPKFLLLPSHSPWTNWPSGVDISKAREPEVLRGVLSSWHSPLGTQEERKLHLLNLEWWGLKTLQRNQRAFYNTDQLFKVQLFSIQKTLAISCVLFLFIKWVFTCSY